MRGVLAFGHDPVRVCGDWYEEPPGAGVREPRRPRPFGPAGVMMLDLPDSDDRVQRCSRRATPRGA
jgi:hypothetical protein